MAARPAFLLLIVMLCCMSLYLFDVEGSVQISELAIVWP